MGALRTYEARVVGDTGVRASDNGDVLRLDCPIGSGPELDGVHPNSFLELIREAFSMEPESPSGSLLLNRGTRRIAFQHRGRAPSWLSWQEIADLEVVLRDDGLPFIWRDAATFSILFRNGSRWPICSGTETSVMAVRSLVIDAMALDPASERRIEPEFRRTEQPVWPEPKPGEYRAKWRQRRLRVAAHFLLWLGWIPSMVGLSQLLKNNDGLLFPIAMTYMVLFGLSGVHAANWPCPRCRKAFGWEGLQLNQFTSKCLHCGLRANT